MAFPKQSADLLPFQRLQDYQQNSRRLKDFKAISRLRTLLFRVFLPRSPRAENFMFCTFTRALINRAGFLSYVLPISSIRLHSFLLLFIACPRPARPDKVLISQFPVSVKNFEAVSCRSAECVSTGAAQRGAPRRPGVYAGGGGAGRLRAALRLEGAVGGTVAVRGSARCAGPCDSKVWGRPHSRPLQELFLGSDISSFRGFEGCVLLGVFQHT